MKVLGIDPGTQLVGYAVAESGRRSPTRTQEPRIAEAGVIRLKSTMPLEKRLVILHRDLSELLGESRPDLLVVEQVFVHAKHQRTAVVMGHARGVVLLAAAQHGVAVGELAPAEVKKSLTGNGRATKQQMQRAVMLQCGLAKLPEPPDVADAIAIALCGVRRRGNVRRELLAPSSRARARVRAGGVRS